MKILLWIFILLWCVFNNIDCRCEWNTYMSNRGSASPANATFQNQTRYECRLACENESRFPCASIEYRRYNSECVLKANDRHTVSLMEKRGWDYYELACDDPCDLGACSSEVERNSTYRVLTRLSNICLCDCISICSKQEEFFCTALAFLPISKTCVLQQSGIMAQPVKLGHGNESTCSKIDDNFCNKTDCLRLNITKYEEPSMCLMLKDEGYAGECLELEPDEQRYFYNFTSKECEPLDFKGCGGNGNNFESKYRCRINCEKGFDG